MYTITTEAGGIIKLDMRDKPAFHLRMIDQDERESFISCVSGYYRLMCKWTHNLYENLPSPSLSQLSLVKCHGPIGGDFAYSKLRDKEQTVGSYLVRQCEKEYDTYYIDIITKLKYVLYFVYSIIECKFDSIFFVILQQTTANFPNNTRR